MLEYIPNYIKSNKKDIKMIVGWTFNTVKLGVYDVVLHKYAILAAIYAIIFYVL